MKEIWKDIEGDEGLYQISNLGRVKSLGRIDNNNHKVKERVLKILSDKDGYSLINLYKNGKIKTHRVHRLVAIAFIENPNNYPMINHLDENPKNNNMENLQWCTAKQNNNYGNHNKKVSSALKGKPKEKQHISKSRKNNPNKRKIICVTTGETFEFIADGARKYNINSSDISKCCKGKQKSAGKHPITKEKMIWKYLE